jgi:hypothetical protein
MFQRHIMVVTASNPEDDVIIDHTKVTAQDISDSIVRVPIQVRIGGELKDIVQVCDGNTLRVVQPLPYRGIHVAIINFNGQLLTGHYDDHVVCYDTREQRMLSAVKTSGRIYSIAPLADERHIAVGHRGYIDIWDLVTAKYITTLQQFHHPSSLMIVRRLNDDTLGYIECMRQGQYLQAVAAGKYELLSIEMHYAAALTAVKIAKLPGVLNKVIMQYFGFFKNYSGHNSPLNSNEDISPRTPRSARRSSSSDSDRSLPSPRSSNSEDDSDYSPTSESSEEGRELISYYRRKAHS